MASSDVTSAELERLIARCVLRDRQAFGVIYQKTSAGIFGFLINMLQDRAAAEEVLQDAFMQLWLNCSTYNPERGQALTWIFSLARYRALDYMRRQTTRSRYESNYTSEPLQKAITPLEMVEGIDGEQYLDTCLNQLQDKARESVVKAYCEGYTHEELSVSMNTPIGTVKSWIRRSIKRLKECLHELSTS